MRQAQFSHAGSGRGLALLIASLAAIAVLVGLLAWNPFGGGGETGDPDDPLVVFCAAGILPPIEDARAQFEREVGLKIRFMHGNSGSLQAQVREGHKGDLYIPADVSFVQQLRDQGHVKEMIQLAKFRLVLAVRAGNPKQIESLDDLYKEDVTFAIGTPDAAFGKTTRKVLRETGDWAEIEKHRKVETTTVREAAQNVREKFVDAALVWDATARQEQLTIIPIPQLDTPKAISTITIGVLTRCKRPTDALRFARYLAAPEKGKTAFAAHHYETLPGDPWAQTPEITLFAGGLNGVGCKETVEAFRKREGVQINQTYEGCGNLVGRMKIGQKPDMYFACDISYAQEVTDLFNPFMNVTTTKMVLLVPKGSAKVRTVRDLAKPGLRLGRADPEQSALGGLTQRLLRDVGVLDDIIANKTTVVTAGTADYLVAQLTESGSLDAVIVYEANCNYVGDKAEIIVIDHPLATAVQPLAVSKHTKYPQLMSRLIDAITTEQSKQRFEDKKFEWVWKQGKAGR